MLYVVFVFFIVHKCSAGVFELSEDTWLKVYRESASVSLLQCAVTCNGDDLCEQFGFSQINGVCFSSNKNDVDIVGEDREVTPDMTVYRKPGTKVLTFL